MALSCHMWADRRTCAMLHEGQVETAQAKDACGAQAERLARQTAAYNAQARMMSIYRRCL